MDHHALAEISLAGICLDVLGGLYLAYDLLGGRFGPLRLVTRAVTYSLVFGFGYGLGLGLLFGIAAGATTGITVAFELQRAARDGAHYPWYGELAFSAIRAAGFAAGLWPVVGARFSLTFAAFITLGQSFAYSRGQRPGLDYSASGRPRLTRRQAWWTLSRTAGYTAAAVVCGLLAGTLDHEWLFALRIGLVTGLVTAVGLSVNPFIEYYADNLAERRLGVFGIWLVLCGFMLQSVQYWTAILDVPTR